MFSHKGGSEPEPNTIMFRRVRQVAAPGTKLLSTIAGLFFVLEANVLQEEYSK